MHTEYVVWVRVLWKQQLMQLNKRADKEPTEVALEDWGISLIICFTVLAYKAVCLCSTSSNLSWHVSSCYPLAGPERQKQRGNSSVHFQAQVKWAIFKIQLWRLVGIRSLSQFTKTATERWIMYSFFHRIRNIHISYCADKMSPIPVTLRCLFSGIVRHTPTFKVGDN